ncbi:MAG: C10 family peptidase, partial [Tidjanibacter sp.]|nr:C10 family peptidase [Tidjanibacter sp.]
SNIVGESNAMPWDVLLTFDRINRSNVYYQDYIAKLVHSIGVGCNMRYGFWQDQSFATPAAASSYMESIGYSNVRTKLYDFNIVKSMLEQDCPVFIGAVRISGDINGHAWVIDGYKKIDKIKTIKRTSGTVISETVEETTDYVHCNWGWENGSNNGWFANTLLKNGCIETADAESFDNSDNNNMHKHYNFWFRIIKYNK